VTHPHLNTSPHAPTSSTAPNAVRPQSRVPGASHSQLFCVLTRLIERYNPAPEARQKLAQRVSAGIVAPIRPERRRRDTSSAAPYTFVVLRLGKSVPTQLFRRCNPAPEARQKLAQRVSAGIMAPIRSERRRCDTSSATPYISVALRLGKAQANALVLTAGTLLFRRWGLQPPRNSRSRGGALAPEALTDPRHISSASRIHY
jgi:hypothetical protein